MSIKPYQVNGLRVLRDNVLVADMNFDERTLSSGLVLLKDDGKSEGIRPRWGRVYATGPEQQDVREGQWICVAHGRWTRGLRIEDAQGTHTIRKVDPKDILLVSDVEPGPDDTLTTAVTVPNRSA
jgi:hypothetical protein